MKAKSRPKLKTKAKKAVAKVKAKAKKTFAKKLPAKAKRPVRSKPKVEEKPRAKIENKTCEHCGLPLVRAGEPIQHGEGVCYPFVEPVIVTPPVGSV